MIRAHQPGSEPIDIPETIPNPVVVPKPTPTATEPAPKEPVRIPEKVPQRGVSTANSCTSGMPWTAKARSLDNPRSTTVENVPPLFDVGRFGDVVAHPILGGLHHRYARI